MNFGSFFSGLKGIFTTVFKTAAKTAVGQIASDIAPIATQVVEELQGDLIMGNADKRQLARDRIEAIAKEQGKEVTQHAVNIAIELALAVVKQGASRAVGAAMKALD